MKTKFMTIVKGRGTKSEKRIKTNIRMYWSARCGWVTIPLKDANTCEGASDAIL